MRIKNALIKCVFYEKQIVHKHSTRQLDQCTDHKLLTINLLGFLLRCEYRVNIYEYYVQNKIMHKLISGAYILAES